MEMNNLSVIWEVDSLSGVEENMRAAVAAVLDYEQIGFPVEIEALIVDNQTIRQMNLEYRNIDRATDVLSFPLYENAAHAEEDLIDGMPVMLGNMVISLERAREQAEEYGHSLTREVCFLTVHSTLHLLGYDHELGDREETEMFQKQRDILNGMGVTRE